MRKAGFVKVKVEDRVVYTHEQLSDYVSSGGKAKERSDLYDMVTH